MSCVWLYLTILRKGKERTVDTANSKVQGAGDDEETGQVRETSDRVSSTLLTNRYTDERIN